MNKISNTEICRHISQWREWIDWLNRLHYVLMPTVYHGQYQAACGVWQVFPPVSLIKCSCSIRHTAPYVSCAQNSPWRSMTVLVIDVSHGLNKSGAFIDLLRGYIRSFDNENQMLLTGSIDLLGAGDSVMFTMNSSKMSLSWVLWVPGIANNRLKALSTMSQGSFDDDDSMVLLSVSAFRSSCS